MIRKIVSSVAVLFFFLTLGGCIQSKAYKLPQDGVVKIQGVVKDPGGDEVEGLEVSLAGKTTLTKSGGVFEISGVAPGDTSIRIKRDGQVIYSESVSIGNTDTVLNVHLFVTKWTGDRGIWSMSFEDGVFELTGTDTQQSAAKAYAQVGQTGLIEVFYNDSQVATWIDPGTPMNGDFIAVRTNRTHVIFSDIRVIVQD